MHFRGGKNLPKMADFGHFFLLTGGKMGGQSLQWGGANFPMLPPPPLDAATGQATLAERNLQVAQYPSMCDGQMT